MTTQNKNFVKGQLITFNSPYGILTATIHAVLLENRVQIKECSTKTFNFMIVDYSDILN